MYVYIYVAYFMQYATMKDGSALGVAVSRSAILTHCQSLCTACLYKEGKITRREGRGERGGRRLEG